MLISVAALIETFFQPFHKHFMVIYSEPITMKFEKEPCWRKRLVHQIPLSGEENYTSLFQ